MENSENCIYWTDAKSKIESIINWWPEKLQVISDFDKTLTYWTKESIIAVLYNNKYISEEYSKKAKELEVYYKAKEDDNTIPIEEKKKLMKEWRVKHEQLLIESKLSLNHIENVVKSWIIKLRDWCHDLLNKLDWLWVPVIVLSASWIWTDSISIYLKEHLDKNQKLYIISNWYKWNEEWLAVDWLEPIITSSNKDETVITEENFPEIYNEIKDRKNVIIIWDKIEDLNMSDWLWSDVALKIWFLNSWNEEKIDFYKKHFDIIINWNQWMQEIEKIIEWLRK